MRIEEILKNIGRELERPRQDLDPDKYENFPFFARLIVYCYHNKARNAGWDGDNIDEWDEYLSTQEADVKRGILAGAGAGGGPVYNFQKLSIEEQTQIVDICLRGDRVNWNGELTKEEENRLDFLLQKCKERSC